MDGSPVEGRGKADVQGSPALSQAFTSLVHSPAFHPDKTLRLCGQFGQFLLLREAILGEREEHALEIWLNVWPVCMQIVAKEAAQTREEELLKINFAGASQLGEDLSPALGGIRLPTTAQNPLARASAPASPAPLSAAESLEDNFGLIINK
jgi:hypothetical protein